MQTTQLRDDKTTNLLKFIGNMIPLSWNHQIKTPSGRPDRATILILSEIAYWYKPSRTGEPRFRGDAWQTSYQYLESKLGYSKETIRRSLIKLEESGLIKRDFRHIKSFGQIYNNVMFILLDKKKLSNITTSINLEKKSNEHLISKIKLGEDEIDLSLIDSQSKKYCTLDQKKPTPSPIILADHIDEEIILENIAIIRSDKIKSEFLNFSFPKFIHQPITNQSEMIKIDQKISYEDTHKTNNASNQKTDYETKPRTGKKVLNYKIVLDSQINLTSALYPQSNAYSYLNLQNSLENYISESCQLNQPPRPYLMQTVSDTKSPNPKTLTSFHPINNVIALDYTYTVYTPNSAPDSRKPLSFFHPLNEEDAIYLRKSSGRAFSLNFINKLLLKLSAKFPKDGAYTKFQLLSKYLTSRLMYEKTNPELGNLESFNFRPVKGTEEHINRQKNKYLATIEGSLSTNPSTLIKQKIIGFSSGDSKYAYHTITNCKLPYIDNSDIKPLSITDLLQNCEEDLNKNNSNFDQSTSNTYTRNTYRGNQIADTAFIKLITRSAVDNAKTLKSLEIKISNEITETQKSIISKAINEVLSYGVNISFKVADTDFIKHIAEIEDKSIDNIKTTQKSLKQLEHLDKVKYLTQVNPLIPSSPLWQKIRHVLSKRFGEATDISWFSKLDIEIRNKDNNPDNIQGNSQIIIKCPTPFVRDWICNNYSSAIEDAVEEIFTKKSLETDSLPQNLSVFDPELTLDQITYRPYLLNFLVNMGN